jgi:hypothetical protein
MVMKLKDSYRLEDLGGFFIVIALDESHCPTCQSVLLMLTTRKRVWWMGNDVVQILLIRRLYCEDCKRIHHEIPDCLVPYKRYGADVIEGVVIGKGDAEATPLPCPSGTASRIRAWWKAVKSYFLHILMVLEARHKVSFSSPPAFRETVRAVANSNNWVFAHQVLTRSVNA